MQPTSAPSSSASDTMLVGSDSLDTAASRIKERYIAIRFRQILREDNTLQNTAHIMRCVRQLLDDERPQLAIELLELALNEDRSQRTLWLCLIELAYIHNDLIAFSELNDTFRKYFPDSVTLPTIDAMGNKLMPDDPRFSHATEPVILPDWSSPESALRDEVRQQKLHAALLEAMTSLSTIPR